MQQIVIILSLLCSKDSMNCLIINIHLWHVTKFMNDQITQLSYV